MSEAKDPAIKLFGKTIQLGSNDAVSGEPHAADTMVVVDCEEASDHNNVCCSNCSVSAKSLLDKNAAAGGPVDSKMEDDSSSTILEEYNEDPAKSSVVNDQAQMPSEDKEPLSPKVSKEEEQSEASRSQEKLLKKPDKILPCPRCNSMDTKFCYFNNYNVNQPRHFCKNCQRYWTAGGTMRNVPVGAGRRKNKHSSSHHRQIVIPDAFQALPDTVNGMIYPALRANTFGSEAPLCKSITSALTTADKSSHHVRNGFIQSDQRAPICIGELGIGTNGYANLPSTDKVENLDTQESGTSSFWGFTPQIPRYPAPRWPNPWNPADWSSAVPPPAFSPSGFPVPIYATPPYWGCGIPGSWNMPRMPPPSAFADLSSTSLSPNSPLGKHPRDGNIPKSSVKEQHGEEKRTETKVLIPKTLRIDDPSEAAKSSIWTTLGIKNGNTGSRDSGIFFRGFHSKGDTLNSAAEMPLVLQANPAALSRSLTYHESAA